MTITFLLETDKLNNDDLFSKYYAKMSQYRKNKIDRMKMRKDKNLSLGAGILLDNYLSSIGLNERDTEYSCTENGKPYLKNHPNIYFNLSHSGNVALCSVSDCNIGCDIEVISSYKSNIAKRFFTENEYKFISLATDINTQAERFFRLWTLKESYLKFSGKGLAGGLASFEINIDNGNITAKENGVLNTVFFKEYKFQNYCIAVCSGRNDFSDIPTVVNI